MELREFKDKINPPNKSKNIMFTLLWIIGIISYTLSLLVNEVFILFGLNVIMCLLTIRIIMNIYEDKFEGCMNG